MKIYLTNTVCCNGGDAAILEGIKAILKRQFGDQVELFVADSAPEVVSSLYPHLEFRPLFRDRISAGFKPFWKRPFRSISVSRFLLGAHALVRNHQRLAARLLTPAEMSSLECLRDADAVLSTGGTYLTENYSLSSRLLEFKLAKIFGKPLILMSQTIGPFSSMNQRRKLGKRLREADLVMVRDQASFNLLQQLNVPFERCKIIPDAAFALRGDVSSAAKVTAPVGKSSRRRAAVSVREWKFFHSSTPSEGMKKYVQAMVVAVTEMVREASFDVTFLSTCQGIKHYWTDDSRLARCIYDQLPPDVQRHVRVNVDFHRTSKLIEILQGFDIVLSTRMHFAILALVANVPVVPISYEFKTNELFEQLGLSDVVCNIEDVRASELIEKLRVLLGLTESERAALWRKVDDFARAAQAAGTHVAAILDGCREGTLPLNNPEPKDSIAQQHDTGTRRPLESVGDRGCMWMVCPSLGSTSEAWMYRQACGLLPNRMEVFCWEHTNLKTFPERGFHAEIVPSKTGTPLVKRSLKERFMLRSGNRFWPSSEAQIRAAAAHQRPAAVLCQYGQIALATLRVTRPLGIPTVVHFHGNDITSRLRKPGYRKELIDALPDFAGIVCVAQYQRDWLIQQGIDARRIRVIPHGKRTL